tara:strand:- start:50 stop:298 length:249 start_codon:yes stop_codon:yes gene_type:complete
MSDKHEMKLMDNEINDLRNQVFYLNGLLDKITEWLKDEIEHNEPIINEDEELSDDTFDIHIGRSECATSLLEQIEKWENENE